jgi:hypothetical protein
VENVIIIIFTWICRFCEFGDLIAVAWLGLALVETDHRKMPGWRFDQISRSQGDASQFWGSGRLKLDIQSWIDMVSYIIGGSMFSWVAGHGIWTFGHESSPGSKIFKKEC